MSENTRKADRAKFEAWTRTCPGHPYAGSYLNVMWYAWQASRSAALDEAAAICDRLTTALDNGGNEYRREASASQCAEAIRAGKEGGACPT